MNVRVGTASERGSRPDMQDSYFVSEDGRQIGVFDGHGPQGGNVAIFAARFFQDTWNDYPSTDRAAQFFECAKRLGAIDGGTTATIAELVDVNDWSELIVHNVGDSPAYVITQPTDDEPGAEIAMTEHHNVYNEEEVERMAAAGSWVSMYHPKYFEVGKDHYIAMSRALGDSACRGIIALPSSSRIKVPAGNSTLIVASDGVLDKSTKNWVLNSLLKTTDPEMDLSKLAQDIVKQAVPLTYDNATAVIGVYEN